jgi:hypothetical protein
MRCAWLRRYFPQVAIKGDRHQSAQHCDPGGLLGLTWVGLALTDRASFADAFPLPTLPGPFERQPVNG